MSGFQYDGTSKVNCVSEKIKITNSDSVADLCIDLISETREHFVVILLNSAGELIEKSIVSIGSLNQSIVHPREVFRNAIVKNAAGIIVAHNHPSGNPEESQEDIRITKRLKECGVLIGIELLDHVIISERGHTSLREKGIV